MVEKVRRLKLKKCISLGVSFILGFTPSYIMASHGATNHIDNHDHCIIGKIFPKHNAEAIKDELFQTITNFKDSIGVYENSEGQLLVYDNLGAALLDLANGGWERKGDYIFKDSDPIILIFSEHSGVANYFEKGAASIDFAAYGIAAGLFQYGGVRMQVLSLSLTVPLGTFDYAIAKDLSL